MAQVQYNPTPDVAASGQATPQLHINTPGDAFGTGIAQAVQQFGGNIEHVGNELFTRAMAIQHLNNEAETREKDSQFIVQSGKLYADYETLQGKNAVDAQPKFEKDILELRKGLRDSLSNPMSQKMFDAQTQTSMARTLFSTYRHMAAENKKWQASTIEGSLDAKESEALKNPGDEGAFQQSLQNISSEVEQLADINGVDKDNLISHRVSRLWSNRIIGLAKTSPFAAKDMLETNRNSIRGQDLLKLDEVVRGKMYDVGSRNVSDAVNAGWAPYMKQGDIDKTVGVEDSLLRVVKEAQRAHPELTFTIGGQGGRRTPEQQAELVRKGTSKTLDSDHLRGQAIDIVPLVNGKPNYEASGEYSKIHDAMEEAATSLGIPLAAKSQEFRSWDPGHFSLPKDFDPRTAPKPKDEDERSRVNRAKAWARTQYPEDEVFQDRVAERVMTDYNREIRQKRDEEYNDVNTLRGVIQNGYGPGQRLPTTVEELTSTPEAEVAWNRLDPKHRQPFFSLLNKNAKGDVAETPERRASFEELRGLAASDPAKFLDTDLTGVDLPKDMRNKLWNLQAQIKKDSKIDPRVSRAMKILGDANILFSNKISRTQNEASYHRFVGNLSEQLEAYQEDNKKQPSPDEVKKIGTRLLMSSIEPGKLWGNVWPNSTRLSDLKVPKDVEKAIKDDPTWLSTGVEPTPERIQQIYVRSQYQRLYAKKEDSGKPMKVLEAKVKPLQPTDPGPAKSKQLIEDVKRPLQTKDQQRARPKPGVQVNE